MHVTAAAFPPSDRRRLGAHKSPGWLHYAIPTTHPQTHRSGLSKSCSPSVPPTPTTRCGAGLVHIRHCSLRVGALAGLQHSPHMLPQLPRAPLALEALPARLSAPCPTSSSLPTPSPPSCASPPADPAPPQSKDEALRLPPRPGHDAGLVSRRAGQGPACPGGPACVARRLPAASGVARSAAPACRPWVCARLQP